MKRTIALVALLFVASGLLAAPKDEMVRLVVFDIAGEQVVYALDKPIHRDDALALRAAAVKAAQGELFNAIDHGKSTLAASQALLAASSGAIHEGRACIYSTGWGSFKIIGCSAKCSGSYCVQVVVQ